MAPIAVRSAPANSKNSVEEFLYLRRSSIPQGSEIRNQAGVPEENGDREIGRDRKDVPKEWAPKIRPDAVIIREGRQIPSHPDSANVHTGKNRSADDRKKGHRFSRTVNRCAPFLSK